MNREHVACIEGPEQHERLHAASLEGATFRRRSLRSGEWLLSRSGATLINSTLINSPSAGP